MSIALDDVLITANLIIAVKKDGHRIGTSRAFRNVPIVLSDAVRKACLEVANDVSYGEKLRARTPKVWMNMIERRHWHRDLKCWVGSVIHWDYSDSSTDWIEFQDKYVYNFNRDHLFSLDDLEKALTSVGYKNVGARVKNLPSLLEKYVKRVLRGAPIRIDTLGGVKPTDAIDTVGSNTQIVEEAV